MRVWRVLIVVSVLAGVLVVAPAGSGGAVSQAGEVQAAPAMTADFRISGDTAARPSWFVAVASNETDGEFLVVWADNRRGTWDIYGRRLSAAGELVGTDFQIYGDPGPLPWFRQWAPAVTWSATVNEYLVVWQDARNSPAGGADWDIYGRRVGADGTPIGTDFRVSTDTGLSDEWNPQVVWNGAADEYLVVWEDWRQASTRQADIYGRRVGADGVPLGADFRVSGDNATGNELAVSVAWNGVANEYLVVWEDGRSKATRGTDVWGRRLGADCLPAGTDFLISAGPAPADVFSPDVVWNGTANEYLVVWEDWRDSLTRGGDVYGRRLGADGSSLGGDFRVSEGPGTSEEMRPGVAWDRMDNEYLVVWGENRADASFWNRYQDIYGRRLGAAGTPIGVDFRISGEAAVRREELPTVSWNGSASGYLVVWADDRSGGSEIYGRLVRMAADSALSPSAVFTVGDPVLGGAGRVGEAVSPSLPSLEDDTVTLLSPETGGPPAELTAGVPITVDVGFVYTRAARVRAGGRAAVEAWATHAVMYANEAFIRSEVDVRLRVVFIEEVDLHAYNGCIGNLLTLAYASVLGPARTLRDTRGADLLSLISEDGDLEGASGPYTEVRMFQDYRGGSPGLERAISFARAWGHNLGADYAGGYDAPDGAFSTIMSNGTGPFIPNYSNPDVSFSWLEPPVLQPAGYPNWDLAYNITGMRKGPAAKPTGVEGVADNASVMNRNAPLVASYRPTVIPEGPLCSGLTPTWVGTDGDDVLQGTPERDVILAGAGDDTIYGLGGSDVICAGPGNDLVYGGADSDFLFGGPGSDTLYGEAGDDFQDGETGNDNLYGGSGNDVLVGGEDNDLLDGADGNDYLYAGPGNDALVGGAGFDRLLGREGNDRLIGGDYVQPGPGTDTVTGPGSALSFEDTDGPVELDLSGLSPYTTAGVSGTGVVHLDGASVHSLLGSRFDDQLTLGQWMNGFGLFGNDHLTGGGRLYGDDGDDHLNGGSDGWIDGGSGTDSCRGATVTTCELVLTDTTAPVVTVPANRTLEATSPAGAVVTFTASANDFPDPDPPVTCVPPSGSLFPLGATTVTCSATDASGNTGTANFAITISPFLLEAAFRSVDVFDGWVLEQDETSGKGGTFDATATTGRLGDDAADRQYRSLLHFDTADLPDNAVITGVTLRIRRQSIVGTNPFDTHGFLTVDMKPGAFHGNPVLESLDFHAVGSRGNVGRFIKTPTLGWYRAPLRAVSYPLINLTGTTQFRLRFATDDNDDLGSDYLSFYTGEAAEADRPQLIITYYLP